MASLSLPASAVEVPNVERFLSKAPSHWVRGPAWDSFWMLSALWLAPVVLWLSIGYDDPESSPLDVFYFGLTALFWIGHRLCSTYLAYCTEAYRPLLRTQPVRFIVLPILVTLTCFAVFLPDDAALPWTREQRIIIMAIIDYGWVVYHFASQHFGVLSLYRARTGMAGSKLMRRLDKVFALGVGGILVLVADILAGAVAYQDQWIDRWLFPAWVVENEHAIRTVGIAVLLVITAVMLIAQVRQKWSWPRVLYITGIAVMVGIALRPRSLFLFLVVWNAQHWIVASGLASQVPAAEPSPAKGIIREALHWLNTRPWAVLLLLVLVSVLLLPVFEVEANRESGTYYGDRIFGAFAAQLRTSSWVPVLVALGFASGFIHYLLDRSIYRMSDPQVRVAARGLLRQ